jgi:hypothetical protein
MILWWLMQPQRHARPQRHAPPQSQVQMLVIARATGIVGQLRAQLLLRAQKQPQPGLWDCCCTRDGPVGLLLHARRACGAAVARATGSFGCCCARDWARGAAVARAIGPVVLGLLPQLPWLLLPALLVARAILRPFSLVCCLSCLGSCCPPCRLHVRLPSRVRYSALLSSHAASLGSIY